MDNKMNYLAAASRKRGYEWVLIHNHLSAGVLLEHFYKTATNDIDDEIKEYWLRGAYDALIGLDIIKPLGKSEAAKQTGYTRNAIQKAIENGYLKATLVDGHYNIHPMDLELWQNSDKKREPYKKKGKP